MLFSFYCGENEPSIVFQYSIHCYIFNDMCIIYKHVGLLEVILEGLIQLL